MCSIQMWLFEEKFKRFTELHERIRRTIRTRGDLIEVTNSAVFVTYRPRLTPWGDCFAVLECCNIVTHDIMVDVSAAEHCVTVLT